MINTSLHNFLKINFPYGIELNELGKWVAFNREYKPLGWNTNEYVKYEDYPIATKFNGLTENFLIQLGNVKRDDNDKIVKVYLYDDATNPNKGGIYWDNYAEKLKMLSQIKVPYKHLTSRGEK